MEGKAIQPALPEAYVHALVVDDGPPSSHAPSLAQVHVFEQSSPTAVVVVAAKKKSTRSIIILQQSLDRLPRASPVDRNGKGMKCGPPLNN